MGSKPGAEAGGGVGGVRAQAASQRCACAPQASEARALRVQPPPELQEAAEPDVHQFTPNAAPHPPRGALLGPRDKGPFVPEQEVGKE